MFSQQIIDLDEFEIEVCGRKLLTGYDDLKMRVELEIDKPSGVVDKLEVTEIFFGKPTFPDTQIDPKEYPLIWDGALAYAESIKDQLAVTAYEEAA